MSDPAADGVSVDFYTSTVGSLDVHYSSGVGNLAFHLLANGGQHPRRASGWVNGVGPDAAMWITFRAYRYYLTSGSDYTDLLEAMTLAAADGYGATSSVVDSVEAAYAAVGVGAGQACTTGHLESAGAMDYLPSGSYVYSTTGVLDGDLVASAGGDVGLFLYRWNGAAWAHVAGSASGSGEQTVSYVGAPGYYLWAAYDYAGATNYSFCWDN